MIDMNAFMHYKNVLSKRYIVTKDKLDEAASDFVTSVLKLDVGLESLPFFAVEYMDGDTLVVKYFVSRSRCSPLALPDGMEYDSYFEIEQMASVTLFGDIEAQSEGACDELARHIEKNGGRITTPVFTVLCGDESFRYAHLKVGYADARLFTQRRDTENAENTQTG